ncbi:MAG: hypothetical protein ACI9U2_001341 [Bradymonadia bacterium]|jgi:hypothetical protein
MKWTHPRRTRLHPRRRQRGSAAIETALSLIVLTFLLSVLLNFGHAMIVRHTITSAASRAARICALANPATTDACISAQLRTAFDGRDAPTSCADFVIDTQEQDLDGVQVLGVNLVCDYVGGPWARFLARNGADHQLLLTANSVMPRR